jgi:OMF family outer membrane factor
MISSLAAIAADDLSLKTEGLKPEAKVNFQEEVRANIERIGINRVDIKKLFSEKHAGTNYDPIQLEASFNEATEITLDDILAKALENNLNLNISRLQSEEARWKFWNKVSDMLPDFTMTAGAQKRDGTFYLNTNFQGEINETISTAGMRLNYRVFDGGTTSFLAWSEKFYREATKAQEKNVYNKVILDTVGFYLELVEHQVSLATKLKALERSKANLELANKFLEAGNGTKYDQMQAEANLAKAQQQLIETEANYRISQLNLAEHLNIPLATTMKIKENKLSTFAYIDDELSIQDFITNAITNNPEIESLLKTRKGAVKEGLSKAGDFLPKVDLYMDLTGTGQEFSDLFGITTLGFQANYNIGDGLGLTAVSQALESNATVDRARLEYEKQVLAIQKSLRTSYINFQKSKALVYANNKQYLAAKEALRLAKLRYENGLEVFTNLLEKESDLTNSELDLISSIANYNLSQVQIAYDMGTINATEVLNSRI